MKNVIIDILEKYLILFSDEKDRQQKLINYLNSSDSKDIANWNNYNGHIVAGGFVYAKEENKFLVLYHKDLKMYLYPGGHAEVGDKTPLETSKREILEETGLNDIKQFIIDNNELIPIDIDTHVVPYNERLNLPEHYHFDFRYLFVIDKIENITIDFEESDNYKWIDIEELSNNFSYGIVGNKIKNLVLNIK